MSVENELTKIQKVAPGEIEKESMRMITEELSMMGIDLPIGYEALIKRVIHTTADFDFARAMCFSEGAKDAFVGALMRGATIVTDTNMTLAGISKRTLQKLGGCVRCFMADEEVALLAKEKGVTRASVSMDMAKELEGEVIFAIGNAPTALVRLYELMQEGYRPAGIIGVPVGFVNVEAAKELIMKCDVPYIVSKGRKGGSTIAAAICNALLYEIDQSRGM